MGNPHAVLYCEDVSKVPLETIGPRLETYSPFPKRINVHVVQVHSESEVTMRTWERGSGITLACGTGAARLRRRRAHRSNTTQTSPPTSPAATCNCNGPKRTTTFTRPALRSKYLAEIGESRNKEKQKLVPKLCLGTHFRETLFRALSSAQTEFREPGLPNRVWEPVVKVFASRARMRFMKIRRPWVIQTLCMVGYWFVRALVATVFCKYWRNGRDLRPSTIKPDEHCIFVLWHEFLLVPMAHFCHPSVRLLVSQHADGLIVAEFCKHMRMGLVRGSSTRGGVEAIRRLLRPGRYRSLAMTPDGPRGPRRKVQLGVIYLAAAGLAHRRRWRRLPPAVALAKLGPLRDSQAVSQGDGDHVRTDLRATEP